MDDAEKGDDEKDEDSEDQKMQERKKKHKARYMRFYRSVTGLDSLGKTPGHNRVIIIC